MTTQTIGASQAVTTNLTGFGDYTILVYLDAQFDHIQGRVCSLAALAVGYQQGNVTWRRETILIADAPPDGVIEERLLWNFADDLFLSVSEAVGVSEKEVTHAESAIGGNSLPNHLRLRFVYFDRAKPLILEAIARHCDLAAPRANRSAPLALYDLLTRARSPEPGAPGASALVTCIATDELPRRDCPVTCQSLQMVANRAGFRWPTELRRTFRFGHFDAYGRHGETGRFYCRRSRRSSQLPDEYFWAAWGRLPARPSGASAVKRARDDYAPFRRATLPQLEELLRFRLAAMAHLMERWHADDAAAGRPGRETGGADRLTFHPARLTEYDDCCRTLVGALTEAVSLERRTRLAEWMSDHAADLRTRALSGLSALALYCDSDQDEETRDRSLANQEMRATGERWSADGMRVVLRLDGFDVTDGGSGSGTASPCPFTPGDRVLVSPRTIYDMRVPPSERRAHPPSARQLLYAARAEVVGLDEERGELTVVMRNCPVFNADPYVFPSVAAEPLQDGMRLLLDTDPNDAYLYSQRRMLAALRETLAGTKAGSHQLYERIARLISAVADHTPIYSQSYSSMTPWPAEAEEGQRKFLVGLDALRDAGVLAEEYDDADQEYIGGHGAGTLLLVQGPPGTGKTQKTVWMMLARIQGALHAGILPFRVAYSANTHAAVDVAALKMASALEILRRARDNAPALFSRYFDSRLLDVTLFRAAPHQGVGGDGYCPHTHAAHPVIPLEKERNKGTRGSADSPPSPANADVMAAESVAVIVFGTPGGLYSVWKERWQRKGFLDRYGVDLLVVDECSRLTLPELLMAGVALQAEGALVAVGDPRQTAPIRAHDFDQEPRRTFKRFPVAAMSVFDALREMRVPLIRFSRSWRCRPEIAGFLRDAIYRPLDGIDYQGTAIDGDTPVAPILPDGTDPLLAAVSSSSPITLVLHDEAASEKENAFEARLIAELLRQMTVLPQGQDGRNDTGELGVVVPHRAQRRLIRNEWAASGNTSSAAVTIDTVERFQGSEREVIILAATESDPLYLREASAFFYDARRLCVAMSRARRQVIVVASKNVFRLENASDEAFEGALLWQRLKRKTCTQKLWTGVRSGRNIEVWAT